MIKKLDTKRIYKNYLFFGMYLVIETERGSAIKSTLTGKSFMILFEKSLKVFSEKKINSKSTVFAIKKVLLSPFQISEKDFDCETLLSSRMKYSFPEPLSEYSI